MMRAAAARLALAGIWCLAVSGCASVSTPPASPFQQFHSSVVQLAASADQALATEQELTYQRFIDTVASTCEVGQLQLQPDLEASIFDMKVENVPLFQEIQTTRSNLAVMHSLVEKYAEFLLTLAGASESSKSVDVEAVATELRTNATSLAATLQANPELDNGWFFGFGVIAREYIESRRHEKLVELLQSADDEIKAFAELGQQAVAMSATGIQTEYKASYSKQTRDADELNERQRQQMVTDVLELNAQTLRQLGLLKQLNDAYGALPGAHLQLKSAVESGAAPSASALLAYAESLRDKHKAFSEE